MINLNGGILILHKDGGMTSHDAVNRIRRLYGTKQVGHTGTLDPMATGVLVVLIGRAVKFAEFFNEIGSTGGIDVTSDKAYRAVLRLGISTDTGDITGTVLSVSNNIPDENEVFAAIKRFEGEIMQIPPMYSALKRGGVKLADLARRGIVIERDPRPVTIYDIFASKLGDTDYSLEIRCSKGTYIRSLCADIGDALGCYGTMAALERTSAHGLGLPDAVTLADLEMIGMSERESLLRPVSSLFDGLPRIELPQFFVRLARNGNEIYQHKIGTLIPNGEFAALCENGQIFAVGRAAQYPDGSALKPVKQL